MRSQAAAEVIIVRDERGRLWVEITLYSVHPQGEWSHLWLKLPLPRELYTLMFGEGVHGKADTSSSF